MYVKKLYSGLVSLSELLKTHHLLDYTSKDSEAANMRRSYFTIGLWIQSGRGFSNRVFQDPLLNQFS